MTDAERAIWRYLRQRQVGGHRFRRQVTIGADFVCLDALLVIEVDGGQHAEARAYDSVRDDFMRGQGFRVLRFWNDDVLARMDVVVEAIREELVRRTVHRSS